MALADARKTRRTARYQGGGVQVSGAEGELETEIGRGQQDACADLARLVRGQADRRPGAVRVRRTGGLVDAAEDADVEELEDAGDELQLLIDDLRSISECSDSQGGGGG